MEIICELAHLTNVYGESTPEKFPIFMEVVLNGRKQ